jgi:hypothetical protein
MDLFIKKSRAATGVHRWGRDLSGGCGMARHSAGGDGSACARW